jgi:hypothetical protein
MRAVPSAEKSLGTTRSDSVFTGPYGEEPQCRSRHDGQVSSGAERILLAAMPFSLLEPDLADTPGVPRRVFAWTSSPKQRLSDPTNHHSQSAPCRASYPRFIP